MVDYKLFPSPAYNPNMVSVGEKTLKVVNLHNAGVPIVDIAKELGITPSSVESRLRSYRRFKAGGRGYRLPPTPSHTWKTEAIKEGFDRFNSENGRLPTANEIDILDYLPSSRQIQRRYGGLEKLREQLGYSDVHFGRGKHRSRIQKNSRLRGNEAEIKMYEWLVSRFGESFVHSEKEYGDVRNRVDFLVYARNMTIGIDVFATDTIKNLSGNVAIKARKYVKFPTGIPLFFVAWGGHFSQEEINKVCRTHLSALPNLRVVSAETAFEYLLTVKPLAIPDYQLDFLPAIKQ